MVVAFCFGFVLFVGLVFDFIVVWWCVACFFTVGFGYNGFLVLVLVRWLLVLFAVA